MAHDAEYIASYVNQIDGPVLLVGHSYGGAVISVAQAAAWKTLPSWAVVATSDKAIPPGGERHVGRRIPDEADFGTR